MDSKGCYISDALNEMQLYGNGIKWGSILAKQKVVSTRKLQPGMRIAQAVRDKSGRAMIESGAYLDDFQIEYLLEHGIGAISIREDGDDDEIEVSEEAKRVIEKVRVDDCSNVSLKEDVKKRVGEGVQYLFNNTGSSGFIEATNNVSDELEKAITKNNAIAIDINKLKVSDEYTFKHSVDVATMAMIIGKKFGLSKEEIHEIGIAGLLHDVGKSKIPNEILNKPARLTDEEFLMMKHHSLFGYNILTETGSFSKAVLSGVLQHHEKMNGKGYPMAVAGDKIHKFARIISVSDVFDALVTERPYKKAFTLRDAVEMIMAMTEDLDIDAMQSFLGSVILYPVDSFVKLSNGEYCKVVENNSKYPLRPKVVAAETGKIYDLSSDVRCASLVIVQ